MNPRIVTRHLDYLSTVKSVDRIDRGIELQVDNERLRVELLKPELLRLKISQAGCFDETPTYAVADSFTGAEVEFVLDEEDEHILLTTAALRLSITRTNFSMRVERADGSVIMESAVDKQGVSLAYGALNDRFVVTRRRQFGDDIYGLGEKTGPFNRDGSDFAMWNTDILAPDVDKNIIRVRDTSDPRDDPTSTIFDPYYITIPFFYHSHPHRAGQPMAGFFIDNSYRGEFEFSDPTQYRLQFSGGQYTEYIFAGPRMADVLRDYTQLTGRTARPPLWALGYHQCRWKKYTQQAVLDLGERMRKDEIPCDSLWLDIDYMHGYRVFTWNAEIFPDPQRMLDELREAGIRVITIIDPGVKAEAGYPVFEEGREHNLFCKTDGGGLYIGQVWPGRTAFPDFSREATRKWWGRLNAEHVRSGLAGIWNDMNEPATGSVDPGAMRFDRDGANHPHERMHNQYGLLMAMGTVEGLLDAMPGKRTFVLSRAGFSGIQRYAANWMGDNFSRWDHLQMSVPMAMGLSISGQSFVGADIGGFAGETNPELLIRWTQYGALTPFCRNHNSSLQDQYPWTFGKASERLIREALRLRYHLMPYIYTAFVQCSEDGRPVQRHLLYDYQDDVACRHCDNQYLFGNDLLVAPIMVPEQTSRSVYLPAGEWYDWHTGEWYDGEQHVTVQAPLERIPLFARAGAVIPLWPSAPASTMGYAPDEIELRVFLPRSPVSHTSELVEDDGLTFDFEQGAQLRSTFVLERQNRQILLHGKVTGDSYDGFARERFRFRFVGGGIETISADAGPGLDSEQRLANAGTPFELRITML